MFPEITRERCIFIQVYQIEWPEVITEGKTLEDCREMLKDALHEMVLAYLEQDKEIPRGGALFEQISVEVESVGKAS
jgi:predicted RNase H-like HicB family nuclease